jgi:hypothetical protein
MTPERIAMKLPSLIAACLLAASTVSFAQAPSGDAAKGPRKERVDCSQAKDPKACEERRTKMKAMHEKASKACEGKQSGEHRECMRKEMCAQSKDPKGCEEHAAKMKAEMQKARKACEGKPQGTERRECMRQEMHNAK